MPLCLDCHERTGSYDPKHPLGRRYQPDELRARRNQVYEHYTSHLVPPISYSLTQMGRTLPDVGFRIHHLGGPDWARVRVWMWITLAQGRTNYGHPKGSRHYNGAYLWNLNPRFGVNGHFPLPGKVHRSFTVKKENVRARIDVTVIDIYERHHKLLPVGYVLTPSENDWYLEPVERELNIAEPRF